MTPLTNSTQSDTRMVTMKITITTRCASTKNHANATVLRNRQNQHATCLSTSTIPTSSSFQPRLHQIQSNLITNASAHLSSSNIGWLNSGLKSTMLLVLPADKYGMTNYTKWRPTVIYLTTIMLRSGIVGYYLVKMNLADCSEDLNLIT